ncbi:unnamed protein product [Amoebophrya sp. A25]|nr:unnamed protein product [Amoebophrya sp. A25]|eukprot:GSA25T00012199001.1
MQACRATVQLAKDLIGASTSSSINRMNSNSASAGSGTSSDAGLASTSPQDLPTPAAAARPSTATSAVEDLPDFLPELLKLADSLLASVEKYKLSFAGASVILRALIDLRMGLNRIFSDVGTAAVGLPSDARDLVNRRNGDFSATELRQKDIQLCLDMVEASRSSDTDRSEAISILSDLVESLQLFSHLPPNRVEGIYNFLAKKFDRKEAELKDEAEKTFAAFTPKVRGRADAEKLLTPLFELWSCLYENSSGPTSTSQTTTTSGGGASSSTSRTFFADLGSYLGAWLLEYDHGTGTLKVTLLRALCRVLIHLKKQFARSGATALEELTTASKAGVSASGGSYWAEVLARVYATANDEWSRVRKAGFALLDAFAGIQELRSLITLESLTTFLDNLEGNAEFYEELQETHAAQIQALQSLKRELQG